MSHVYLVGRPNVGKTFLFNQLTGENQKVANFSGATVRRAETHLDEQIRLVDLPGIYSLNAHTEDEKVTADTIHQSAPDDLICLVLESLKLQSQIPFILSVVELTQKNLKPMILLINMIDEAEKLNIKINAKVLRETLGVTVFLTSAKTGQGLAEVKNYIQEGQNWSSPEPKDLSLASSVILSEALVGNTSKGLELQIKIDRFLLSPFAGSIFFMFLTFMIFQSIFTWATPLMDLLEGGIASLGAYLSERITSPFFKSFTENAIFAGFGSFLVFTPQIFILTTVVGILEKSGYMARATVICHKFFSLFGLSGKSFIPYMTGHACAIPAIYAARTIENSWIRNLTILTVPLTSCSARIPVYALLIRALIPDHTVFFGLIGLQGLAFFGMYFFGIFMALMVSTLIDTFARIKNGITEHKNRFFIMELPSYRVPGLIEVIRRGLKTTWSFIRNAGPIIFMVNAAIWFLSYFPAGDGQFEQSYMVQLGQWIEPVFQPLGLTWTYGVAIIMSFLAREVFVSTLGLLQGFQSDDLDELVAQMTLQDLSTEAGFALLVFFAIALQCASTVGVLHRETSKKSWAYAALVGYLVLAFIIGFIVYQALSWIGRYV